MFLYKSDRRHEHVVVDLGSHIVSDQSHYNEEHSQQGHPQKSDRRLRAELVIKAPGQVGPVAYDDDPVHHIFDSAAVFAEPSTDRSLGGGHGTGAAVLLLLNLLGKNVVFLGVRIVGAFDVWLKWT